MKSGIKILIGVSIFALAACGSEEKASYEEAPDKAAEAANSADSASLADTAKAAAEKAVEALKLDTSSLDSFKSSLSELKNSLNSDQRQQLTSALADLAKDAVGDNSGGTLGSLKDAAKSVASGKSTEEILYENMASKLDGMTFEDILKLAG